MTEWEAYEAIAGPIGDGRLDQLFAMLQATIANVNRGRGKAPYEPKQFVPKWGRPVAKPEGEMSGEDMLAAVKKLHKRMGGR